jgi:hypothetical protein
MARFHELEGFVIVAGWGVLFLFGVGLFITKRDANRLYWGLLTVLQVLLGIQLLAGLVLFAQGGRPAVLHYLYGAVFPALVLVVHPRPGEAPLPPVLHHRGVLRVRPDGQGADDRAGDRLTRGPRPATLSFNLPARPICKDPGPPTT